MSASRIQVITADFFTGSHRFSASVAVGNRRLSDVLNDRLSDYLQLRDIYVSRIHQPGEIVGTYRLASVVKRDITFVVLPTEQDGLSQEHKYNPFSRSMEDVFITLPSVEISGKLELLGKFDLKAILAVGTTTFMPLLNATAVNATYPDVRFAGPVTLVNKRSVEFFSVLKHG
jgi:hypothetical protein